MDNRSADKQSSDRDHTFQGGQPLKDTVQIPADNLQQINRNLQAIGVPVDSPTLTLDRYRAYPDGRVHARLAEGSLPMADGVGTVETQLEYIRSTGLRPSVEIRIGSEVKGPDGRPDPSTKVSLMLNQEIIDKELGNSIFRIGMQLNPDSPEDLWLVGENNRITSIGLDEGTYLELTSRSQGLFVEATPARGEKAYEFNAEGRTPGSIMVTRLLGEINYLLRTRTDSETNLLPPDLNTQIDFPTTVQAFMKDEMYSHRPGAERRPNAVIPLVFYKTE